MDKNLCEVTLKKKIWHVTMCSDCTMRKKVDKNSWCKSVRSNGVKEKELFDDNVHRKSNNTLHGDCY